MRRLHLLWLFGGLLVILVIYFGYQARSTELTPAQKEISEASEIETSSSFSLKKDETGSVTVSVTPKFTPESSEWDFALTLQTHSVELSMDILESVVLLDADGSEGKPLSWDGDPPEGHHRTGTLRFAALDPVPDTIVLRVKDIAGVPVREFVWEF